MRFLPRRLPDVQGVPREKLVTYNCLADQELREGIKEYSEWPTIPQVYVKGEFVGGCDIVLSSTFSSPRRWIAWWRRC
jgi:glutaredoxin-related protein